MRISQFTRRTRRAVALLLLPVLVFALGLRVCLHADGAAALAPGQVHAAAVHLESDLTTAGHHDESSTDVDVSFEGLMSLMVLSLLFVLAVVCLRLAPVLRTFRRISLASIQRVAPPPVYLLAPPLRAPPR
jgi:hypothetical protein